MSDTTTVRMAQRGVVTLPKVLRENYNLRPGDDFTLLDLGGVFVLSPRRSEVDSLADRLTDGAKPCPRGRAGGPIGLPRPHGPHVDTRLQARREPPAQPGQLLGRDARGEEHWLAVRVFPVPSFQVAYRRNPRC